MKSQTPDKSEELSKSAFDTNIDGNDVKLFYLKNEYLSVAITNYGARIVSLEVKDKNNHTVDVSAGFDSIIPYTLGRETYFGAVVGRYANRIANGKFSLNNQSYSLPINSDKHHLHGGTKGFSRVVWQVKKIDPAQLILQYLSKDGEEGYPGNLMVEISYTLSKNILEINYEAVTDNATILNLTNHTFFNLNGFGKGNINRHLLKIYAHEFTPIDESMIPTGAIISVEDTPFDFREFSTLGTHIDDDTNPQIRYGKGFDHNFVLDKKEPSFQKCAEVIGDLSGICMEVWTTEPGMQLYSGNFLDGTHVLKNGFKDDFRSAFCLETQHFPNAPNEKSFPSTELFPGEIFRSKTSFVFNPGKSD
ncbi:MAG: galactose mutarotase [Bacteroidetes bacterium]|nr:galactose mutarotase [Bacteroidota bacterium]